MTVTVVTVENRGYAVYVDGVRRLVVDRLTPELVCAAAGVTYAERTIGTFDVPDGWKKGGSFGRASDLPETLAEVDAYFLATEAKKKADRIKHLRAELAALVGDA